MLKSVQDRISTEILKGFWCKHQKGVKVKQNDKRNNYFKL